jgi:hypothetical protein
MSMIRAGRLTALAAAFVVGGGVAASAQTVMVRNAPAGSAIEVVVNGTKAGSATTDPAGEARIPVALFPAGGRREMDARVSVDVCSDVRRVMVVEPGQPALPEQPGCIRSDVAGLYVVRRGSWLVVNLEGPNPTMMLLRREYGTMPRTWSPAPGGLVLFGGWGVSKFSNAALVACGNVTPCADGGYDGGYTAGAAYWFTRYTAAEAAFVKPGESIVTGSGENHRFTSELDARVFTIAGTVGVPAGPVRFYGRAGGSYHQATTTTTQTIDDRSVTVGGVEQLIEGGTQTNALETDGWSWTFGGGMEAWVTSTFGLYAEFSRTSLKGKAVGGGEATFDDRLTAYTIGARIHLGR